MCGNRSCVRYVRQATALTQESDPANTYRLLTLFRDVFQRVRSEYVEPENALNGMFTGLDPHSAYMNAEEFRQIQEDSTGEFSGLGVEVVPESGFFKVIGQWMTPPRSRPGSRRAT